MNLVFLGPPGSGKGTQANMLSQKFLIPCISTGDLLRKEVENKTEIGLLANYYIEKGDLVSDEIVIEIIKKTIIDKHCESGFILDGFPRNIQQALNLQNMLLSVGKKINKVINFNIDDDSVIKRISGRFFCKECKAIYNNFFKTPKKENICDVCGSNNFDIRKDDNESTVKNRLVVYHNSTKKLIEFYEKNNLLISVDATRITTLLFEELVELISK
jgi:adenylate kinase